MASVSIHCEKCSSFMMRMDSEHVKTASEDISCIECPNPSCRTKHSIRVIRDELFVEAL